ncbi:MAG: rod shape-determining protein MreC [Ilumatobacter sp.]|jgi:rod shape-determining protein MreC|uniref:rod shape-determining protein MreC n=1 Tax=Ilumatobacter sp. TaxID=1967498 RepID=UPI0039188F97
MAIYTVGRRRVIIALLLTSALILTLDLRGNAVLDRARDAFGVAMQPVERATEVVANPIRRVVDAYSNYDDLERENQALRELNDRLIGTQAAAEASVVDLQEVLALNDLPSLAGIETEKAEVVGASANNIDQIVEINKGSLDNIAVGMPVVNQAGLIGRVTQVFLNSSKVMLVTDPRFAIPVEVIGGTAELDADETLTTTPSGLTPDEVAAIEAGPEAPDEAAGDVETDGVDATGDSEGDPNVPGTTTVLDVVGESNLPQATLPTGPAGAIPSTTLPGDLGLPPAVPADGSPVQTVATVVPPTTLPIEFEKEFGALVGRGQGLLPQIRFLQDNPSLATLQVGDLVETAGGADSLAPPNIPIGRVINRADRPGVAGPILEVELNANLDKLNFVQVVLFRPASEVGQ